MAKWKAPNPKINNASKRVTFKVLNALASLTFFSTNHLKGYLEFNWWVSRENVG